MRLTKIVCTLGPASDDIGVISKMVRAGMDVARLNFSHGTPEEHEARLDRLRKVAARAGRTVAVMQDLCGPKLRVGEVKAGRAEFVADSAVLFSREPVEADATRFSCAAPEVVADLRPDDPVLINDGRVRLVVTSVETDGARCRVVVGGAVESHKGINLPGAKLRLPALTDKDRRDLAWGLAHDVDYVALSFVRKADDILELRRALGERARDVHIVAKLEKPEVLGQLEAIIDSSDAVMVARGDLGVEMPIEQIPATQKRIIAVAARRGKPVITATEMLQSMIESATPTRAEVTDVANAILDGSDAVMLSGETSVGRFPVEAVSAMSRIAEEADGMRSERAMASPPTGEQTDVPLTEAMSEGARQIAQRLPANLVAVGTHSGVTARVLSKEDLALPIFAASDDERACRRMALYRGVIPARLTGLASLDQMFAAIEGAAVERGLVNAGNTIVIIGGVPFGRSGTTNTIQVRRVGASLP